MARQLTARGEQRRRELLAFATNRFAENGYHPTSVAELVDGLGVGKGVFYWYFESKEDLFLEILRSGEHQLRKAQQSAMRHESNPLERMEAAIRASMHWWVEHRDLYTLIQFASTEASFAENVHQGKEVTVDDTARLLQQAMDEGLVPPGDEVMLSQAILGVSAALARTQLLGESCPPDEVADAVIAFCRHGLHGNHGSVARTA